MKAPITARKHYVQFTEFNVASATVTELALVDAKDLLAVNAPNEVVEGSVVKAIYVELWLTTDAATTGSFVVVLEKVESEAATPVLTEMTTLMNYNNKKNILFCSQGILATEASGNPTPVMRQWFKIPRGKQRMGQDDQIRVLVAAIGANQITGCSFSTYKEYK